jgi:hypothetical protein
MKNVPIVRLDILKNYGVISPAEIVESDLGEFHVRIKMGKCWCLFTADAQCIKNCLGKDKNGDCILKTKKRRKRKKKDKA